MLKQKFYRKLIMTCLCTSIGLAAFAFGPSNQVSAATSEATEIISTGKDLLGTPYRYGSSGTTSSFDCSSFVQYVFNQSDISLPRTSSDQAEIGEKVGKSSLSKGDLMFFNTNGKSISHVAIYIGDNKMLHAASGKGVTITDIDNVYWKSKFVTARRVL
ncbi:C40 family peptidase [Paenibacillus sp. MAHUQ-46]|uniref:C40 family peptidase n=2 Tax=Paenibacillus TaxID=44249 RepID=A0A934MJI7_9BACL|nr:C40 family peptidase [Paenibacillus roseus]MBJ6359965.1 C40 family peptidase [Paenibacillus roseus]